MIRVPIQAKMFRWARTRARKEVAELEHRFPALADWESGAALPTLRQVEDFAKATHVPVGFLFLSEPPVETLPIPDCRTNSNQRIEQPSPDLLDTLYLCQRREEWHPDNARKIDKGSPAMANSLRVGAHDHQAPRSIQNSPNLSRANELAFIWVRPSAVLVSSVTVKS